MALRSSAVLGFFTPNSSIILYSLSCLIVSLTVPRFLRITSESINNKSTFFLPSSRRCPRSALSGLSKKSIEVIKLPPGKLFINSEIKKSLLAEIDV